jgi:hypothetical protein
MLTSRPSGHSILPSFTPSRGPTSHEGTKTIKKCDNNTHIGKNTPFRSKSKTSPQQPQSASQHSYHPRHNLDRPARPIKRRVVSVALVSLARRATPDADAEDADASARGDRLIEVRVERARQGVVDGDFVAETVHNEELRWAHELYRTWHIEVAALARIMYCWVNAFSNLHERSGA